MTTCPATKAAIKRFRHPILHAETFILTLEPSRSTRPSSIKCNLIHPTAWCGCTHPPHLGSYTRRVLFGLPRGTHLACWGANDMLIGQTESRPRQGPAVLSAVLSPHQLCYEASPLHAQETLIFPLLVLQVLVLLPEFAHQCQHKVAGGLAAKRAATQVEGAPAPAVNGRIYKVDAYLGAGEPLPRVGARCLKSSLDSLKCITLQAAKCHWVGLTVADVE